MDILQIRNQIPRSLRNYEQTRNFYQNLSLRDAVENAGNAIAYRDLNGQDIFSDHQRRVGKRRCSVGANYLLEDERFSRIENARTFSDLFSITEEVRNLVYRLGPLWSYDTAQKIGFHLSREENDAFYPQNVYLQSGARTGAFQIAANPEESMTVMDLRRRRFVARTVFPHILANEPAYIIENILCVGQHRGNNWFEVS